MWKDYRSNLVVFRAKGGQNILEIKRPALKYALEGLIEQQVEEAVIKAKQQDIKCVTPNLEHLRKFVKAATGKADDADVVGIANFLLNVKCRFFGLKGFSPVIPVLNGPQGNGKSRAIERLLKTLETWTVTAKLSAITDSRNISLLQANYIAMLDELEIARMSDLVALKIIAAANTLEYRLLNTNSTKEVKQNCSFIATTYNPLDENIVNELGTRFFCQINCLEPADHATINNIEYLNLWRGIDETRTEAYK